MEENMICNSARPNTLRQLSNSKHETTPQTKVPAINTRFGACNNANTTPATSAAVMRGSRCFRKTEYTAD